MKVQREPKRELNSTGGAANMSNADRFKNVGPNLYKDGKGYYHATRKIDGKPQWKALETKKRKTANKLLAIWIAETDANPLMANKDRDITLRKAVQITLSEIRQRKPHLSEETHQGREDKAEAIFRACSWKKGADILFANFTGAHASIIFNRAKDPDGVQRQGLFCYDPNRKVMTNRPVGSEHYNVCLKLMKKVCADRVADKFRSDNPMIQARLDPLPRDTVVRFTPTKQEAEALVAWVRANPWAKHAEEAANFLEATYQLGLGPAELLSLTWGMLDYDLGAVRVVRIKTGNEFKVPFFEWCHALLNRLLALAIEKNGGQPPSDDTKLFSILEPRKLLSLACEALKLRHYDLRSMRRVFIYCCCWGGIPRETVAKLQGHRDKGKLINEVYDNALCDSDTDRDKDWVDETKAGMGKVSDLYGGDRPELMRPDGQAGVPRYKRFSVTLANRLDEAINDHRARYEARNRKCVRLMWSKVAKRLGLPFDPAKELCDQCQALKDALVDASYVGQKITYLAKCHAMAAEFDSQEREARKRRIRCRTKITNLMAVIRENGVSTSEGDRGVKEEILEEMKRLIVACHEEVAEAEATIVRIRRARRALAAETALVRTADDAVKMQKAAA